MLTSGSRSSSAYAVYARLAPCCCANASARPRSRLTTATSDPSLPSALIAGAVALPAKPPVPMMPHPNDTVVSSYEISSAVTIFFDADSLRTRSAPGGAGGRAVRYNDADMLRHSVIWLLRDTTTADLRVEMLKGLAYLRMECPMVRSGDYGADIFGGSQRLHEVPQAERIPVWRRGAAGPPSNYDVALHLDFDDWSGHEQYSADPAGARQTCGHVRVGRRRGGAGEAAGARRGEAARGGAGRGGRHHRTQRRQAGERLRLDHGRSV